MILTTATPESHHRAGDKPASTNKKCSSYDVQRRLYFIKMIKVTHRKQTKNVSAFADIRQSGSVCVSKQMSDSAFLTETIEVE